MTLHTPEKDGGLENSGRRNFLVLFSAFGVNAAVSSLIPNRAVAQTNTSAEIDTILGKYSWYQKLYTRLQKDTIKQKGSLLDVPNYVRIKVVEFLKANQLLNAQMMNDFSLGYNSTQLHHQMLLEVLQQANVSSVLQKVDDDAIYLGKKLSPGFVDDMWEYLESVSGVNLDTLYTQYGKETLLGVGGVGFLVLLAYVRGKMRERDLNKKIVSLKSEKDGILESISGLVGNSPADGTAVDVNELLERIRKLESDNGVITREKSRLEAEIAKIIGQMGGTTSQNYAQGATGTHQASGPNFDSMLKQIEKRVAELTSQVVRITQERDAAQQALEGFEYQVGMMHGGREFIEKISGFAAQARTLFEKMDREGVKAFGRAVIVTIEEVDGLLSEVHQLVRQVAANMSEEEQGVWLDIPVRLIQEAEKKHETGEIKEAYKTLMGVKMILEFIQALNQGGGQSQEGQNTSDWDNLKQTQFRDLNNIIIETQEMSELLGGAEKGCEVGKIVDPFLFFDVSFEGEDHKAVVKNLKPKYKKLAQLHHPDKHQKSSTEEQKRHADIFKVLAAIWQNIEDETKFSVYMQALKACYPEKYSI